MKFVDMKNSSLMNLQNKKLPVKAVTVVGIGDDGCVGLSSKAMGAVASARVLAGGERQLDFFPEFTGEKIVFKSDILHSIERIVELSSENTVCVLASGDPLFFGIGNLLRTKVGEEHIRFIPAPSSVQYAFAAIGLKWDDADVISLHGRPITGFINKIQTMTKIACLTDDKNTPQTIAKYMLDYNETEWAVYVCENLNGENEKIRKFTLAELISESEISPLNVMILLRKTENWRMPSPVPFRAEEEYAKRIPKKGLITKKEVRVLSIAAMQLRPNSVVWDIGAGSGSVAVEAAQIAKEGKVYAIEVDLEGVEICRENILTHKTDNVIVVHGLAPNALSELDAPDAVFVGGSKGNLAEIIHLVMERLSVGGSLVVNAVTLDNVAEAYQCFRAMGIMPEVSLINVSRGQKLVSYLRYEALNPIHIFSVIKTTEKPISK